MTGLARSLVLRCLLRRTPQELHGSINNDKNNDYVFIALVPLDGGSEHRMVVRSIQHDELVCSLPERNGEIEFQNVPLDELPQYSLTTRYFFRGWVVVYDDLSEAFREICLRDIAIRRILQVRYDRRLKLYNDRIGLLRTALDLGRGSRLPEERTLQQLCEALYGDRITLSEHAYDYLMEARFLLASLRETGDIAFEDNLRTFGRFTITPKAIETIANHELEAKKFRDNLFVMRGQFVVPILLLVLTAVLVWAEVRT